MIAQTSPFGRLLHDFRAAQEGSVAIVFAILLLPLMVFIGAALDYSRASSVKTALQTGLDATVLRLGREGPGADLATPRVTNLFEANFNRAEITASKLGAQYNAGDSTLSLDGSIDLPTMFMGIVGIKDMTVSAVSRVRIMNETGACVIALDGAAKESFKVQGAGTVSVPNCGIYVNSSDGSALSQIGGGWIKAKAISVVGGTSKGGNYSPKPKTKQKVIADPLASLPEPTIPSTCTYKDEKFDVPVKFPAGSVFCGAIALNAGVTFAPGIHYFKAATVTTATSNNIDGDQVMLYFDDTSTFTSASTGKFSLVAPQSGTYMGIAMFASRKGKLSTFKLTGSKDYFVKGTIYLPTVNLTMYGTADLSVSAKSGYVIAQRFFYTGDSGFTFDAHGGAVPMSLSSSMVALIK